LGRRSQVVRQRPAKPLSSGSNPLAASILIFLCRYLRKPPCDFHWPWLGVATSTPWGCTPAVRSSGTPPGAPGPGVGTANALTMRAHIRLSESMSQPPVAASRLPASQLHCTTARRWANHNIEGGFFAGVWYTQAMHGARRSCLCLRLRHVARGYSLCSPWRADRGGKTHHEH
jgi:hypothetical protein